MIMTSLLLATAITAQSADRHPLATVTVASADNSGPSVSISRYGPATIATQEEWAAQNWVAVRTKDGVSEEVTSSECPAVKELAVDFKALPPITATPASVHSLDQPLPVNGVRTGGVSTVVSFHTLSGADVTVGGGDAYSSWGSNVINRLSSCWKT